MNIFCVFFRENKSDMLCELSVRYFSEKIRFGILCELSALLTILIECQVLSFENYDKKIDCHPLQVYLAH